MLYQLEQGAVEDFIIKQSLQQKLPLPDKISNAPILLEGLALFYQAFWDLSTTRNIGMGEGSISWMTISEYCLMYGIEGEQRDDLIYHVQRLDAAYLKYRMKKNTKKPELSKTTKPPRRRR